MDKTLKSSEEKGERQPESLVSGELSRGWSDFKHTDTQPLYVLLLANLQLMYSEVIWMFGADLQLHK